MLQLEQQARERLTRQILSQYQANTLRTVLVLRAQ